MRSADAQRVEVGGGLLGRVHRELSCLHRALDEVHDAGVPLAQYGLSVGVTSWELDLLGRIRSLSAQALEQHLEAVQASFQLTRRTFELGTMSELDLRTAESQLETARANVAAQTQAQAVNALVYLVGQPLPAQATVRATLPSSLPSDLLQRRPDILADNALAARQAVESQLAAELARLSNTAALYRALGGGWREHTAEATPRATPAG